MADAVEPAKASTRDDPFADLIEPFNRRGVDLGLGRLQAALAELGHPERQFQAVQVAGTNGKGSIATLVHRALVAAGIRAGLYTSPHLVTWCERIRLGTDLIEESALRGHLQNLQALAQRHRLTPFELVTAAAFQAFAAAGCELVVLEVGLGGRLDATTCHPDRRVVGFGAIGLDHSEFLGSTTAAIAAEKAGVIQAGGIAISARQSPEVAAVLEQRAQAVGGELRWVEPLDRQRWPIGIPGAVQASNGAVARGMLLALGERGWSIGEDAIRTGMAQALWPGRLQTLPWRGHTLLLDGAHNLPAAQALRAELDRRWPLGQGHRWVLGMLANKDAPAMLNELLSPDDHCWIVPVPGHASWSLDALHAACPQLRPCLHEGKNLEQALGQALDQALIQARFQVPPGAEPMPVVVAGSLYLIGHLLASVATE